MSKEVFMITPQQLKLHIVSLMKWGQDNDLAPDQLSLVMQCAVKFLNKELGIDVKSVDEYWQIGSDKK